MARREFWSDSVVNNEETPNVYSPLGRQWCASVEPEVRRPSHKRKILEALVDAQIRDYKAWVVVRRWSKLDSFL